jgi:hypothetical protein
MSQINPFTGSVLQAPQVQRQQAADKDRQLRRVSDQAKNAALNDDKLEHQVESSDVVAPTQDHPQQPKKKDKRKPAERTPDTPSESDQPPRVDLTA